jgi:hypothetical protein
MCASTGVGLYFIWLKYLIGYGAVASLLHLPAILMAVFGEVREGQETDVWASQLFQSSIVN